MIFPFGGIQTFYLAENRGIDPEFDALSIPHTLSAPEFCFGNTCFEIPIFAKIP